MRKGEEKCRKLFEIASEVPSKDETTTLKHDKTLLPQLLHFEIWKTQLFGAAEAVLGPSILANPPSQKNGFGGPLLVMKELMIIPRKSCDGHKELLMLCKKLTLAMSIHLHLRNITLHHSIPLRSSVQNTSSAMSFLEGWTLSPKVEVLFGLPNGERDVTSLAAEKLLRHQKYGSYRKLIITAAVVITKVDRIVWNSSHQREPSWEQQETLQQATISGDPRSWMKVLLA